MKTLHVVATPIGNLGDLTFRAVEILKSADLVLAEDTRHTRILFQKYEISRPLQSCHAQTSPEKIFEILKKLPNESSVALVSDAGTPGISDPGFRAVRAALDLDFKISPIPGASALSALVSVAGVPADKFTFLGFLPHKKGRQTILKNLKTAEISTIFYESVHRFPRLLDELFEILKSDRVIVVGRELTKIHEEIFRGTVGEAQSHFTAENTRGEFVVLVAPKNFSL
ncbi:16S rRNA (cytidine(1402)-2'-O)-methyltransferase [bacterium]|jgi:16S rRNA (cytidine1402-2'-O)-methyltransferase|nr:16S rRNA (cytidine(1402)-2'-O)-methyltransferase [bacterium]MBT6832210.1 16S rRNA (cytidine(1402)-2'-O)-methyltransferase [bacterium]MBT6996155.1 16S rRNA (cytidine(1402)-2'-O)-methyltransferase [bacterium]MBT7772235.1 16S rRNA (cytidine(1402)-2'-O)-methyltransferase [bacterium]